MTVTALKPRGTPVADWERISPKAAERILDGNKLNRSLSNHLVSKYAAEMAAGEWDEDNGETIKISADNELLDGQHRLWAVIESGVTLKFLVVRGVARESFKTIDIGKTRTTGDIVGMAGVRGGNHVAAAAAMVMAIQQKKMELDTSGVSKLFQRSEIIEWTLTHKDPLEEAVRVCSKHKAGKFMSLSTMAACFHLFVSGSKAGNRRELAESFFQQLGSGVFDDRFADGKHPVWFLRERLSVNRVATTHKLTTAAVTALTIKAWNAYLSGKPMSQLRVQSTEVFPAVA